MAKRIVIVLAEGFEETEAIAPADVLKRLGYRVQFAGLRTIQVRGSHGFVIAADTLLDQSDALSADAILLPGGLPGATNLRDHEGLIRILQQASAAGRITGAICAAPIVLAKAGLTEGKRVTGYPGTEKGVSGLHYTGTPAEIDGTVVTGKGPGASFAYAAAVAKALGSSSADLAALYEGMFVTL